MKSIVLVSALAASAAAYIVAPRASQFENDLALDKRQILATLTNSKGAGKIAGQPGDAPRRVTLPTNSKVPGVRRVKIRYGPYKVPNANRSASLTGEKGMLWNYPDTTVDKPCSECTIVHQVAGLEYPDGTNANIDTGMWLHHMVHFTRGPTRWDPTCIGKGMSLPHFAIGASADGAERYFSSGNERTNIPLDIYGTATNAGYHLNSAARYALIDDLKNMNMEDKIVYMTIYYDYLDGPLPAGWKDIKTIWFDANQCGTSEVPAPKQSGAFTISSGKWVPNLEGDLLGVGGHLHDGGVAVHIKYGADKLFCNSQAAYGEKPEFVSAPMDMDMPGMAAGGHSHGGAMKHISSMTICFDKVESGIPVKKLDASQVWSLDGLYDYDKFEGAKHGGKQDSLMAIALMYVAVQPGGVPKPGAAAKAAAGGKRAVKLI